MKIQTLFLLLFSFILFSCQEEDDDEIQAVPEQKVSPFSLSTNEISWFLRDQSDSISINISGGEAPYIITHKPDFAANAKVVGNRLIVFPKPYDASHPRFGLDFLNLQDSEGNVNSLNINVLYSLYHNYQLETFNWTLIGDTNITQTFTETYSSFWDAKTGELVINSLSFDNGLSFHVKNVYSNGLFNVDSFYTTMEVNRNGRWEDRFYLFPKTANEKISITQINSSQIVGSINLKLVSNDQASWPGTFNLTGNFSLSR